MASLGRSTTPAQDELQRYEERIAQWFEDKRMTAKQVWRLLREEGVEVGYSNVKRYMGGTGAVSNSKATVRIEVEPAEEAQVDLGYAGLLYDPQSERKRKAWAFIMTLSYSRHRLVRFVFRMDVATWIECLPL